MARRAAGTTGRPGQSVRLVREHKGDDESQYAAIKAVAACLGIATILTLTALNVAFAPLLLALWPAGRPAGQTHRRDRPETPARHGPSRRRRRQPLPPHVIRYLEAGKKI